MTRAIERADMPTPPAEPVEWIAKTILGGITWVKSRTWYEARSKACVELKCEPYEVYLEQV